MNTKPSLFDCILSESIRPFTDYLDALSPADRFTQLNQLLDGADDADDCEAESSVRLAILRHYKSFLFVPHAPQALTVDSLAQTAATYDRLLTLVLPSMQYAAATCGIASRVLTATFYAGDYQGCAAFIGQLRAQNRTADLFHLQDALLNAIQVVEVDEDAETHAFELNAYITQLLQDVPTDLDPRFNLIPSYAEATVLRDYFFSADSVLPFNLLP